MVIFVIACADAGISSPGASFSKSLTDTSG